MVSQILFSDDYGPPEENIAMEIVHNLLKAMQRRCEETMEVFSTLRSTFKPLFQVDQKLLFYNLGTWFQNVYGNNPMELVRMVKKVLSVEQMIIQNASQQPNGTFSPRKTLINLFCSKLRKQSDARIGDKSSRRNHGTMRAVRQNHARD